MRRAAQSLAKSGGESYGLGPGPHTPRANRGWGRQGAVGGGREARLAQFRETLRGRGLPSRDRVAEVATHPVQLLEGALRRGIEGGWLERRRTSTGFAVGLNTIEEAVDIIAAERDKLAYRALERDREQLRGRRRQLGRICRARARLTELRDGLIPGIADATDVELDLFDLG